MSTFKNQEKGKKKTVCLDMTVEAQICKQSMKYLTKYRYFQVSIFLTKLEERKAKNWIV